MNDSMYQNSISCVDLTRHIMYVQDMNEPKLASNDRSQSGVCLQKQALSVHLIHVAG